MVSAAVFWFVLFAGPHDGVAGIGAPKLTMGPFQTIERCYAAGALGINALASKHEDRDFRGACISDLDVLPIHDLATRAGAQ